MDHFSSVRHFFQDQAPIERGEGLVAAFSGGSDSTALLLALRSLIANGVWVRAVHVDHGWDTTSGRRALAAQAIAERLGVPFERVRLKASSKGPGGWEASARRHRYAALERARAQREARWIATGHHRDDQVETVLLRLLAGSGLEGLAAMAPVHGRVVRPLLPFSRSTLEGMVRSERLSTVSDPSNEDRRHRRNFLRHELLPSLSSDDRDLGTKLLALAGRVGRLRDRLDELFHGTLAFESQSDGGSMDLRAFRDLPPPLQPFALNWLHRRAGAEYPPTAAARTELNRQLATGRTLECHCGGGWRWQTGNGRLTLRTLRCPGEQAPFAYTLRAPGRCRVPEAGAVFRLDHEPLSPWMFRGSRHRAGLNLQFRDEPVVVVRSRQPGDRVQPLGATHTKRLKELLIDHKIPRKERDRIPLLVVDGKIVWVPGVTVDESCRLTESTRTAWVAEIEPEETFSSPRR